MNKSISIKEGSIGRRIAPVDKIKINTSENDESLWVPAERGNTGVLYASENGIYIASEDGYESYSEVVVRVTEESFYGDKDFDHWNYEVPTDFPDLWDSLTLDDFNVDPLAFDDLFNNKDKWDMDIPDLPDKIDFKMKDLKTKKIKKEKITGIDPVSGNEMAVGLDNFGRLTEEILPTSIEIITPPNKLVYTDGETILFDGLVVQAYTADGNVWTDKTHPDGIIPMNELSFPVTIADYNSGSANLDIPDLKEQGSETINTIADTRIANDISFNQHSNFEDGNNVINGMVGDIGNLGGNYPVIISIALHDYSREWEGWSPYTVHVFYTLTEGQDIELGKTYPCYSYATYGRAGIGEEISIIKSEMHNSNFDVFEGERYRGMFYEVSTINASSDKDRTQTIPVQWYRVVDGQLLETSFDITVKKSGSSGGGGSSQAITYNGTRYVANDDMNAEAHYQSGTVWIRGEAKVWSVPDAVAFGLLKPEEEKDGGSDSGSEHEGGHF